MTFRDLVARKRGDARALRTLRDRAPAHERWMYDDDLDDVRRAVLTASRGGRRADDDRATQTLRRAYGARLPVARPMSPRRTCTGSGRPRARHVASRSPGGGSSGDDSAGSSEPGLAPGDPGRAA